MRAKEWAAVAALTFAVLETHVGRLGPAEPRPEAEPFRKTLSLSLEEGAREASTSFAIPRGKRLILELATASVAATREQGVSARVVTQGSGEDVLDHRLGLAAGERAGTLRAVQPLRAFADAGTTVTLKLERARFGEASAAVATLFGYWIDVP